MKSNVQAIETTDRQANTFIKSFSFPTMGATKFTPKNGFRSMTLDKAEKLFSGKVADTEFYGTANDKGYLIVSVVVGGKDVGTLSFISGYEDRIDEFSSDEEVAQATSELAERLKHARIVEAVEDGEADMAAW